MEKNGHIKNQMTFDGLNKNAKWQIWYHLHLHQWSLMTESGTLERLSQEGHKEKICHQFGDFVTNDLFRPWVCVYVCTFTSQNFSFSF